MHRIIFREDGTARFIFSDELAEVGRAAGTATILRASHVEPTEDGWWYADMTPVSGPFLGPYRTRSEALLKEIEWLEANDLPIPGGRS